MALTDPDLGTSVSSFPSGTESAFMQSLTTAMGDKLLERSDLPE
jgi:hypothetical protein